MTKVILLASAAALALTSSNAVAKSARPMASAKNTNPFHFSAPPPGGGYSQRDNDNGVGIVSQNFTDSGFSMYDAAGADDFKVKKKAKISEVDVDGIYFNGAGPADSIDVIFYQDAAGKPGPVVATCEGRSYTDETGTGTFDIPLAALLPSPKCGKGHAAGEAPDGKIKAPLKLTTGTYWVSVVPNMSFSSGGEWGWLTNNTVRGNPAQWQNPGGGFGVCPTWGTLTTCISAGEGGDFSYALVGKVK